jgi:hypothetical protein
LQIEFADSSLDVENLVNHASEQWTEGPHSDDEDAIAAYEDRDATDKEEADESEEVLPMTLRQAREAGQALKNQGLERMRPYLKGIEALVREKESMTVSARTQQTDMYDYFLPERAADGVSPVAGTWAD